MAVAHAAARALPVSGSALYRLGRPLNSTVHSGHANRLALHAG